MKPIRIAGAMAALLLVAATLLIAIGIPAGALTGAIQNRIERDTGYRVTIAGTGTVRLFPAVALTLHDVSAELPGGRAAGRSNDLRIEVIVMAVGGKNDEPPPGQMRGANPGRRLGQIGRGGVVEQERFFPRLQHEAVVVDVNDARHVFGLRRSINPSVFIENIFRSHGPARQRMRRVSRTRH